jgi:hypothetical protein
MFVVQSGIRPLRRRLCCQGLQHGHHLLLIVGRLRDARGDDQHHARIDSGLRVAALLEAATRDRHDARLLVGEIDLIFLPRTGFRGDRRGQVPKAELPYISEKLPAQMRVSVS